MPCNKVKFTDKRNALTALNQSLKSRNERRKEIRAYYCHQCKAWHLTSRTEENKPVPTQLPLSNIERWEQLMKPDNNEEDLPHQNNSSQ